MMSDEKKREIQAWAILQFTDDEIAKLVDMDERELVKKHRLDIDTARLRGEAEIRKAMFAAAKEGNASAQKGLLEHCTAAKMATRAKG